MPGICGPPQTPSPPTRPSRRPKIPLKVQTKKTTVRHKHKHTETTINHKHKDTWVWLKIKRSEGQTAGFGPCVHLPGFDVGPGWVFEPQPLFWVALLFPPPPPQVLRSITSSRFAGVFPVMSHFQPRSTSEVKATDKETKETKPKPHLGPLATRLFFGLFIPKCCLQFLFSFPWGQPRQMAQEVFTFPCSQALPRPVGSRGWPGSGVFG